MESLLYRFKGLGERALQRVFLWGYRGWFLLKYWNALLVLAPFHANQDHQRGFSPLKKIFSFHPNLRQPFEKSDDYKQSDQRFPMRKNIRLHVTFHSQLLKGFSLNQRMVIVDDVVTSGETMIMMIDSLQSLGFYRIEAFALCRPTKA
jgi:predicted amidophosphoribosyltransferase